MSNSKITQPMDHHDISKFLTSHYATTEATSNLVTNLTETAMNGIATNLIHNISTPLEFLINNKSIDILSSIKFSEEELCDDKKLFLKFMEMKKIDHSYFEQLNEPYAVLANFSFGGILAKSLDAINVSIPNEEKINPRKIILEQFKFLSAIRLIGIQTDYELFVEVRMMDYKILSKFNDLITKLKIINNKKPQYVMELSSLLEKWVLDKRLNCFMNKTLD